MKTRRQRICALVAFMLPVGVTGCFGDNILSAGAKLLNGQISQLTAGEIMVLNDVVVGVLKAENPGFNPPPLTSTQAGALSTFFQANTINTVEDAQLLAQTAQADPTAIQGLPELATAFAGSDLNIDPNNIDSATIDQIFGSIFGGSSTGGGTGGGTQTGGTTTGGTTTQGG